MYKNKCSGVVLGFVCGGNVMQKVVGFFFSRTNRQGSGYCCYCCCCSLKMYRRLHLLPLH